MEKPALADFAVHELIRRRWSPRSFSERPVADEELRALFEAARWAPSSYNEQPWSFVLTRKGEESFDRLAACLTGSNVRWAPKAPVLILSIAKLDIARTVAPNRHALHDVGMAVGNLVLQATALDLFVHQMAGFDPDKARRAFGVPEGYEPVAIIAIGFAGNPDALPDDLRDRELRPRARKPLRELVFASRWGDPSPLVADRGIASESTG